MVMFESSIIQSTACYVKRKTESDASGHDWFHAYRVWKLTQQIVKAEGANSFSAELTALLHDIADWKENGGDDEAGPQAAKQWLDSQKVPDDLTTDICHTIRYMSFKGANTPDPTLLSLEGQCVQDADRIDAMGAIGIARCFSYTGSKGRIMHDPRRVPQTHTTFEQYKAQDNTAITHFYEKLLLLKDRMNTPTGKQIAQARHDYMEQFLAQFFSEWEGQR